MDWSPWERRFADFLDAAMHEADAAHDRAHIRRVVATARALAREEGAEQAVVVPAAWLHDCVVVSKDAEDRAQASTRAAERAAQFLQEAGYPPQWIPGIRHAIAAHSYSAGIPPETPEACVVQDADRLDALGAIGIARCFAVGGALGHALYDPADPFCADRTPDDGTYVVDHFYAKLFELPATMQTDAGRAEAERRVRFMKEYLRTLGEEITGGFD